MLRRLGVLAAVGCWACAAWPQIGGISAPASPAAPASAPDAATGKTAPAAATDKVEQLPPAQAPAAASGPGGGSTLALVLALAALAVAGGALAIVLRQRGQAAALPLPGPDPGASQTADALQALRERFNAFQTRIDDAVEKLESQGRDLQHEAERLRREVQRLSAAAAAPREQVPQAPSMRSQADPAASRPAGSSRTGAAGMGAAPAESYGGSRVEAAFVEGSFPLYADSPEPATAPSAARPATAAPAARPATAAPAARPAIAAAAGQLRMQAAESTARLKQFVNALQAAAASALIEAPCDSADAFTAAVLSRIPSNVPMTASLRQFRFAAHASGSRLESDYVRPDFISVLQPDNQCYLLPNPNADYAFSHVMYYDGDASDWPRVRVPARCNIDRTTGTVTLIQKGHLG